MSAITTVADPQRTRKNWIIIVLASITLALIAAILELHFRRVDAGPTQLYLLLHFTLPMIATAILVGAALSASAATLQVLLANPLADPGIIGISSGASLVAAIVLLTGLFDANTYAHYMLPLTCFMGAMLSTALIYQMAKRLRGAPVAVILAGIAISTVSGAIVAWLYYFADAQAMRNLTFWLMGSLYQADVVILAIASPLVLFALGFIFMQRRQLNRLFLGQDAALAAGVDVRRVNRQLLLACAVAVGVAVSLAGSIAFIGLLIPHSVRLLLGHDNIYVIPASALLGSALLLAIGYATEVWAVTTLPVSMLTATIGGPLFVYALLKGQLRAQ
ncbi:FecCD family ABC transporter permease [Alteromonas flava]|uniref:FecCD family ABC transporter permease n=1 Tax=Alteromonas flava TaxID=2048003 RepID=UPI0013DA14D1|nr:iron ABC transporter permease [Alteromonas flava]